MKVAVVEDSPWLAKVWEDLLPPETYTFELVDSSVGGVAKLIDFAPEIIVFNAVPAQRSAFELVSHFKQETVLKGAYLVLATSFDAENITSFVDPAVLDGVLWKPFTRNTVLDLFDRFFIDHRRQRRAQPLVVIVDDSSTMRRVLSREMRELGFEPMTGRNGEEGFALIKEHIPDIALVDMAMPVMSGTELCASLAADPLTRTIPVIMVSAIVDEEIIRQGFNIGIIDFVKKPFDRDRLAEAVRCVLGRNQSKLPDKLHALVLESDEMVASILLRFFTRLGLIPHLAGDVITFNALLKLLEPDIITLNLALNDGEGLNLCRQLRAQPQMDAVPIVAISTDDSVNLMLESLRSGVNDYIRVPFANEELFARINNLLRVRRLQSELIRKNRALEDLAVHDGATGMFNRAYFDRSLSSELARAERSSESVALLVIELDDIDVAPGVPGRRDNDDILRTLSSLIRRSVREYDVPCRYGEGEIGLLLPRTSVPAAISIAERLRSACVEQLLGTTGVAQTVSIGVSVCPELSAADSLVADAEWARQKAKSAGQNCVMVKGIPT